MKKLLISISVLLLLVGCAGVKKIETVKVAVAKTPLNLDLPDPIDTNDLEFIVINKDNYKEVFEKLTADGKKPVLFALTDDGYKALSMNYADLREHIISQREIIIAYKEYYESDTEE